MDPLPTSEPSRWRERARSFAEAEVLPLAAEIDRTDRVPDALIRRLAEERFLGVGLPESAGGSGGGARDTVAVLEELSRASSAVAVLVAVHLSVCAAPILAWGTAGQKERFGRPLARGEVVGAFGLTEPGAGSDTARIATRYARDAEGFRLNGTKMFISSGVCAGVLLIFATRDPALGHRGISAFIVPANAPGFEVAQRFEKLGLRGSETTELVLQDVRLPLENLLGDEGEGLRVALGALTGGRVGIAACALGVAQAAFDEMVLSVRTGRADWGRSTVARSYAELSAARALVEKAAERKDAGLSFVNEASAAKLVASRVAVEIGSRGVELAGPQGSRAGAAAGRLWRDARVYPIVEGTTEIQELILARSILEPEDGGNP